MDVHGAWCTEAPKGGGSLGASVFFARAHHVCRDGYHRATAYMYADQVKALG